MAIALFSVDIELLGSSNWTQSWRRSMPVTTWCSFDDVGYSVANVVELERLLSEYELVLYLADVVLLGILISCWKME